MDFPEFGIEQQRHARSVSGEDLELLGKKASDLYRTGREPSLTKAVVAAVKTAGLSPLQVQRVIEFANTDAFLTAFRKEGQAHRVIDLPGGPAIPTDVLNDLNDGGGGSVYDRGTRDYESPPEAKQASVMTEEAFRAAWGVTEPPVVMADPLREAMDIKYKLAGAEELLTQEISTLERLLGDANEELYSGVKQAALEGYALGDIVAVMALAESAHPVFMKRAFEEISPRLVKDGVFSPEGLESSFQKTASGAKTYAANHPLTQAFEQFSQVLFKLAESVEARNEIGTGLSQVTTFLNKAAGADGGLWQGAKDIAAFAGKHLGDAAEAGTELLLGKGSPHAPAVGSKVRWVAERAPHLAVAGAGLAAYRDLKHNRTVQGVLGVVPGTQEYRQKELEAMMRSQDPYYGAGY